MPKKSAANSIGTRAFFSDTAEVFVRRERMDFERKTIERQKQEYLRELERNIKGHPPVTFF
ncbi:hypothetical protein LEP1GSC050_2476 [Leptospira broomii serovar Hurstbridge str. 5399]|uniref:Uncharacterized protein n=1 Tax=Leptospira broomii serovar Hurstbridge str. 5399 TaxID=1049789 RepID=T0FBK5_9LEPT|nr:hypothetical protein LEP1GSC050_2476 [Leptospira broomii serovar Hurstbridge str. 5399]